MEYISLSVTKADDWAQGPHPESRLVREEDELGEAEEGNVYFSRVAPWDGILNLRDRIGGIHTSSGKDSLREEGPKRRGTQATIGHG